MAKFKYKFKSVKEIKERFEKKAQKELATIELAIATYKKEIVELKKEIKKSNIEKKNNKLSNAKDLHFYEKYQKYLEERVKIIIEKLKVKEVERNSKLEELVRRSKETKTFELLEEKHFNEFIKNENKIEQKEMDEFAAKEFIKG